MKILIAYDGSECANDALEDLSRAGLPYVTDATVLTVTETFLTPEEAHEPHFTDTLGFSVAETFKYERGAALEKINEAEKFAARAAEQIRQKFPTWTVREKTINGFPEYAVLEEAREMKPDLIVTGSHGRSGLGRLYFGSVSLKILSEAECSVRVARRSAMRAETDDSPLRILIAVDGSGESEKAIETVLRRTWAWQTAVRFVSAIEPLPYSTLMDKIPTMEALREKAAAEFKKKDMAVSIVAQFGRAKSVILAEAEKWGADMIFIGEKSHHILDRVLLGSLSYVVAARAHCSVEVIR